MEEQGREDEHHQGLVVHRREVVGGANHTLRTRVRPIDHNFPFFEVQCRVPSGHANGHQRIQEDAGTERRIRPEERETGLF